MTRLRSLTLAAAALLAVTGCKIVIPAGTDFGPLVTPTAGATPGTPRITPTPIPPDELPPRPAATPSPGRSYDPYPNGTPSPMPSPSATPSAGTWTNWTDGSDFAQPPEGARVRIDYISSMATDSQGRLYLMGEYDHTVWRRELDGSLTAILKPEELEKGPECITVDHQDRLLVLENGRASRWDPETGKRELLADGVGNSGGYIAAGPNDEVYVLDTYTWDTHYRLIKIGGGGVQVELGADRYMWGFGVNDRGQLLGYINAHNGQAGGVVELDPETGEPHDLAMLPADAWHVDAKGGIYASGGVQGAQYYPGDGSGPITIPNPSANVAEFRVVYAPTKTVYASSYWQVLQADANGARWVAGTPKQPGD